MSIVSLSMSICTEKEFCHSPPSFYPAVTGLLYSIPAVICKHSSKVALTKQKPPFLSPPCRHAPPGCPPPLASPAFG